MPKICSSSFSNWFGVSFTRISRLFFGASFTRTSRLLFCGVFTRTPTLLFGTDFTRTSRLLFAGAETCALALVVNTNEKTTAATVLMSIIFALEFLVIITLIFYVYIIVNFVIYFLLTLQRYDDFRVSANFESNFLWSCCDSQGGLRQIVVVRQITVVIPLSLFIFILEQRLLLLRSTFKSACSFAKWRFLPFVFRQPFLQQPPVLLSKNAVFASFLVVFRA